MLAIVAAGFALYRLNGEFRWDVFLETFADLDPVWFAFSCVLLLITYVVRALRWRIMLRPLQPHPYLWGLISATCIGFTAITLFGRPGELVRPYLISVRERVPFSSQLAAWLLERIYDLMMILIIFGYALTRLPKSHTDLGPALGWFVRTGGLLAAGIGFACVIILIAASRFTDETRARLSDALAFLPPGLHRKAGDFASAFTSGVSSTRRPSQIAQLLSWSIVEWFMVGAATLCLFRSFPVTSRMGWIEVMIFIGFSAFGSIVQIPGIGGGAQVAGILVLTKILGLDLASATGVAILFWFVGFVLIVPCGLALMLVEGVKLKSLRHIPEAEKEPATPLL